MATQSDVLRVGQLPELLDYDSISVLLGISKRTLQRLVESEALHPDYVSPHRPRFRIEDIAEFRLRGIQRAGPGRDG
jgi:hypothetical protein